MSVSSTDMEYSSLDENSYSNSIEEFHVGNGMDNQNSQSLIPTVTLGRILHYEMNNATNNIFKSITTNCIHLIIEYYHPITEINTYFVILNGSNKAKVSNTKILIYKDDTISNLQKNIAANYNVSFDHIIVCEFWNSILLKLNYKQISMISKEDQIIAYWMPLYIDIKKQFFNDYDIHQLSYTSLVHQYVSNINDNNTNQSSLTPLQFPYYSKKKSISVDPDTEYSISELEPAPSPALAPVSPYNNKTANVDDNFINFGIPFPLMLPKHSKIETSIITNQCDMILKPYLKDLSMNINDTPYDLVILTKNTVYCGICQDDAFCGGCNLNQFKEISTNDLDFVIGLRWKNKNSLNIFNYTALSSNNYNQLSI